MKGRSIEALETRLRTLFPDREFIMRSQGQVRFIKITTRIQTLAALVVVALVLVWVASMAVMSYRNYAAERDRLSLLDREAKVATAENRVAQYRNRIDSVADDLARRQKFIEQMVEAHIGDLPKDNGAPGETVSNSTGEADKTIRKVSAAMPAAAGLAKLEARQLAFVERLTRYADRRSAAASQRMAALGLNPNAMLASAEDDSAEGGPLERLSTEGDGSLDPRFQRLGMSLARMDALEQGLAGIPQVDPADHEYISSGFGYRSDPFTGAAAFHAGLDFRGPIGAPVYAAAKGRVSFAGQKSGYGNCIEIDHGNGLVTRYAHMSRFVAHVGQLVTAGQQIGAIGSTGRSTGPHLHFEVRIHDRPVNPRPFLEYAQNVRQEERTGA